MRTVIYFTVYVVLLFTLEAIIDIPQWGRYIGGGGGVLIFFEQFYRVVLKKETKYRVIYVEEKRPSVRKFWVFFKDEYGRDRELYVEGGLYGKVDEGETIGIIYRGTLGLIIVKSNGSVIGTKWYWYLISKNEKHIKAVCVELLKAVRASNKK